jgi:DNA polymerase-3 subunit alpha
LNAKYACLHAHTYFSLLDSPAKPESFIHRAAQLELNAIATTDHGSVASSIEVEGFAKKAGIKHIKGLEGYICKDDPSVRTKENRALSHLVILAKNKPGWNTLVKIVSESNRKDYFYHKPRLDLKTLAKFLDGNIIGFSGHPGSCLSDVLFTDHKAAYSAKTLQQASAYLKPDAKKQAVKLALYYQDIFRKGNFFLEIQDLNRHVMPAAQLIADILRQVSLETGILCVATADSHYCHPENKRDQQILLCGSLKTTLKEIYNKIANDEDVSLGGFFKKDAIYHIPALHELRFNTTDEISNTNLIADMCETYEIATQPEFPSFDCPNGLSQIDYLKELARQGWKKHGFKGREYSERAKHELEVIEKANLAGYFLIVQDYVNYMKDRGRLVGSARGSAGGCLLSLLLGIIQGVDPVKDKLWFERFYNDGRNTPDRIAVPDIDVDFGTKYRYEVFDHMKGKYGADHFAHLATYGALKGRAALKDVLRITEACDANIANEITANIADESKISDELQLMREAGDEPSIIIWALQNNAKYLSKYCELRDNGTLQGEYAKQFEQAIRLEGCKRTQSRHPSAVVLSKAPMSEMVPLLYDKTSEDNLCGFDMYSAEKILVKFDILSISLDKISDCVESIQNNPV